jgi:hypothetical protein
MPALGLRRTRPDRVQVRDHEETFTAGHAYYAPPGHTPVVFADSEIVEFSPSDALADTSAVVTDNMRAAGLAG